MLRLPLRDIQFRILRTLVTTVAISIVFSLVLLLAGIVGHFRVEARRTVRALGADRWVVARGGGGPFTDTATVPAAVADELRAAGAVRADPLSVVALTLEIEGKDWLGFVLGHEPGGLGTPRTIAGRRVAAPGQMVIGREAGLSVGASLDVAGRSFRVVGLTEGITMIGGQAVVFLHIADARELFYGGEPLATAILVKGEPSRVPEAYAARSPTRVWTDALRSVGTAVTTLQTLSSLLWIAAVALLGVVVYVSTLERVAEIATLKALGGSAGRIWLGIVLQSVLMAFAAALIAAGLCAVYVRYFPFDIEIPGSAYRLLGLLAAAAGVVGSAGGVRRATKVDPAEAFTRAAA